MRKLFLILGCLLGIQLHAQTNSTPEPKPTKYQGLLWEISGNGLQKPSYLYGTMHVSRKLAFHLGDSFFLALQNSEVVGLETTPDTWLDDMIRYDQFYSVLSLAKDDYYSGYGRYNSFTPDKTYSVELSDIKEVNDMLRRDPRLINSFMFRKSSSSDNFEEETYLDLYIFRVGKKLGKKVIPVEDFAESEALVEIAQDREYGDKDDVIEGYEDIEIESRYKFFEMFEDAYRRGDLDMLDSLNKMSNPSKKYNKYMLWIRNANMVRTMDTIMPNQSMFVGVGAAHLPGKEGVIELLRKKGYTVRPVSYTGRSEKLKDKIDKIEIDIPFSSFTSSDGMISLEVPGKMTEFPYQNGDKQSIATDMVNGHYYIVSRMEHHASWFGMSDDFVLKRVDSLLFENIPGKILKKKEISLDGYKGLDIENKTKRGDYQRYQIFVTPNEVVVVKLAGSGEYAKSKKADRFFKSIRLKKKEEGWKSFTPVDHKFSVDMPANVWTNENKTHIKTSYYWRRDYFAKDPSTQNSYFVLVKPWYATYLLEEDSFQLRTALRSFQKEDNYTLVSHSFGTYEGRLCINAGYLDADSQEVKARAFLNGQFIYLMACKLTAQKADGDRFLNSFKFQQPNYRPSKKITDSLYFFTVTAQLNVNSPIYRMEKQLNKEPEDDEDFFDDESARMFIQSPSTDEVVFVDYEKYHRYKTYKDSAEFWNRETHFLNKDSSKIEHEAKYTHHGYYTTMETYYTDSATTRAVYLKSYLVNGRCFSLFTVYDTTKGLLPFSKEVFESFVPMDTIIGTSPFINKPQLFFQDLSSSDSAYRRQALIEAGRVKFLDEDAPALIQTFDTCEMCKDFEERFITEVGLLQHPSVLPFMMKYLAKAGDTANLQLTYLDHMVDQQTVASTDSVKQFIMDETPLPTSSYKIPSLFNDIQDSLDLAKRYFPDFMNILFLEEYRSEVYELLAQLVDSGKVNTAVYDAYRKQIAIEAKNNIKRLATTEKASYSNSNKVNELISQLHLLAPYYKTDAKVRELFDKAFAIQISTLRIDLAALLLSRDKTLPESISLQLAKEPDTRAYFYALLKRHKKESLFPKAYRNQDSLCLSIAYTMAKSGYGSLQDSIVFIGKYEARQMHTDGYVYVYRVKRSYGDDWRFVTVGLQPKDQSDVNLFGGLNEIWSLEWKKKKDINLQVSDLLDEVLIRRRRFQTDYSTFGNDMIKYFLSPEDRPVSRRYYY
ncbi:MAG: TraB/GumN family protein [Bacteroidetes bacterium]|nr:MAG: TraB/GumN family protein [Bacteroidota bacterium]